MMRVARLKTPVAVAATLILATVGVAVQGRPQTAPDLEANRALAREQLALIDKAVDALRQLARHGRVSIASPSFSLWGRRRLETLRRTGAGKAEIVAALEQAIQRLKEDEVLAKGRLELARGTQLDVYDVQFRRVEAEIWLNEEKAR